MATTKTTIGKTKKQIKPTTAGTCKVCHKKVQALEAHIQDKHKKTKSQPKRDKHGF